MTNFWCGAVNAYVSHLNEMADTKNAAVHIHFTAQIVFVLLFVGAELVSVGDCVSLNERWRVN